MSTHLTFLLLGLGSGAVIAALAMGVVVTHRASHVVNFAHGAIGTYLAFVYYEFRDTGDIVQPFLLPGVPERFALVPRPTVFTALLVTIVLAAIVGVLCYVLIFRPLRTAPPLARIVASLGLMTYLIGVMDLRFDTGAVGFSLDGPLPTNVVDFAGVKVFADRYWLAAIVVVTALAVWAMSRFTTFGLATRASAENETGATLLGISADRIGMLNWALAAVLAGLFMILAAPITLLDAATTPLLIIPALGAALLGQFRSIGVTVAAGLGIGMVQSELQQAQAVWDWLPDIGLQQGAPFLVVLLALLLRGDRMPGRGDLTPRVRLPAAPEPRNTIRLGLVVAGLSILALFHTESDWRTGLILSAIATVMTLSVVVLTGFVGQISLATFALAGTAAFSTVRAGESLGLGFPWAPLVGVIVAVGLGTLAGLPAIRIRGLTLAIASLAAAAAIEELIFRWSWFSGGLGGSRVEPAALPLPWRDGDGFASLNLDINAVGAAFPRRTFGIFVIVIALLALIMVVNLRRSATGRQWLAVRANERAAEAIGISAPAAKLSANAVAALLAGVGGVLIGYQATILSASSYGALRSLVVVAMAYLAGIAAPAAALVAGALTQEGLLTVAMDRINDDASQYQFAINGLVLIIAAIKFPRWHRRHAAHGSGGQPMSTRPALTNERIVDEALVIVRDDGLDALSMRALAGRLGVTAPALYAHFDGRDGLLRACAQVGYDTLAERVYANRPERAIEMVRHASHAYVDFALEEPALFSLMFLFRPDAIEVDLPDENAQSPAHEGASTVFSSLVANLATAMDDGEIKPRDRLEAAFDLWATAHGVAAVGGIVPGLDASALLDRVLDAMLDGWKQ